MTPLADLLDEYDGMLRIRQGQCLVTNTFRRVPIFGSSQNCGDGPPDVLRAGRDRVENTGDTERLAPVGVQRLVRAHR